MMLRVHVVCTIAFTLRVCKHVNAGAKIYTEGVNLLDPLCHGTALHSFSTNDSKATVSVLYWYGNYPHDTVSNTDFLESGLVLAPCQLL